MNKDTTNLYSNSIINTKVTLFPTEIGTIKTKENLQKTIAFYVEGKCTDQGYIKPKSVQIINYSSGNIKGDKIEFEVTFECKVCNPPEGMWLNDCIVKSKTKAGIHAHVVDDAGNTPITCFVLKEHFKDNNDFDNIEEEQKITVKIIGSRFELNDNCVEVIGNLMPSKQ